MELNASQMPGDWPGGGGAWAVVELTGTLHLKHSFELAVPACTNMFLALLLAYCILGRLKDC